MLIEKFLYSVIENSDSETLFKVKDKFLVGDEIDYVNFVKDFYSVHSKFPDIATINSKFGITLIANTEPASFWFDELYGLFQEGVVEKAILDGAKKKHEAIKIFQQAIVDYNTELDVKILNFNDGNPRVKSYTDRKTNGGITYLSTGRAELDEFSLGYKGADLWTIGGFESVGKAEPLSNKILTYNRGVIKFGELTLDDMVYGSNGLPQNIEAIHPQGVRSIYRITFADKTFADCDGEHLWDSEIVSDRTLKKGFITRTTLELKEYLAKYPKSIIRIPDTPCVSFARQEPLPIHPYLLGCLLGDDSLTKHDTTISNNDIELIDRVKELWSNWSDVTGKRPNDATCIRLKGIDKELSKLGLKGTNSFTKFIPDIYLTASISDRIELLRGLMDTDGYNDRGTCAEFAVRSKELADDTTRLVRQLGGIAITNTKEVKGKPFYMVRASFHADNFINPFYVTRKANGFKPRASNSCYGKVIRSIEYIREEEAQCISVSNSDSLYLTGEDCIVTHNTWQLLRMVNWLDLWCLDNAITRPILIVSGEMTSDELADRLDAIRCEVSYQRLTNGSLKPTEERKYMNYLKGFESNVIMVDSFDGIQDVEYFVSLYRPCMMFIDGSHLLAPSYDWKDIAQVTARMKSITRNNKVPIVNTTHLKAEKGKSSKGGELDDFAYTKGYTRDSDIVGVMFQTDLMGLENQVGIDWVKVRRGNKSRSIWQTDYETSQTDLVETISGKELALLKGGASEDEISMLLNQGGSATHNGTTTSSLFTP